MSQIPVVADRDWIGAISPMHYDDPTESTVVGEYDVVGATCPHRHGTAARHYYGCAD